MKIFAFLLALVSFQAQSAFALSSQSNDLPQLHVIKPYVFTAPYSCNGNYSTAALFLTQESLRSNHPELLDNGACRSQLYFENSVAGRDMSLISYVSHSKKPRGWSRFRPRSDAIFVCLLARSIIGDYPLEDISAQAALNIRYLHPELQQPQPFYTTVPAKPNQTYSALLARDDLRYFLPNLILNSC